jgi:hypothetical protein
MRHVAYNPSHLKLRDGWAKDVENLRKKILAEKNFKKRAALINDNAALWREVKQELSKLFNGKCWYTESKQEGTDTDVDHFRPKKRVAEVTDKTKPHPGYWWLAFNLENYRYSCIFANRRRRDVETGETGGKSDHFPLWSEDKRAWTPECDCDEEIPLLLDPCKATDVALITFKEDGEAMSRHDKKKRPKAFAKADKSIAFYNINHSDFVKSRIALRDQMDDLVSDAVKYYKKLELDDAIIDHAYERAVRQLKNMRDKDAPYSSYCVAYLDKYKHEEYLEGVFL